MTLDDFKQLIIIDGEWAWVLQVFVVVFGVLLLNFVLRRMLNRLHQQLSRTKTPWDDALIDAARRPLSWVVWIVGLAFAVEIVRDVSGLALFEVVGPIRDVGVVACLTWFLIRFISKAEHNLVTSKSADGKTFDRTTMDAIAKLLRASVVITAVLVTMQTLGFSISGVLAFGGIGGIAVGFAAKDLLANFFGGLMIYLDRPFAVGDWIRSPDRDIEGTVEKIGWRLTCIRTFDKRPLYLPNNIFTTIAVENPSRMSHRRIYETIGVRYDDAEHLSNIVTDVKQMLIEHSDIDSTQTLIVNFNKFAPSSLDFFVYTFTHTTNWVRYHEIKHEVMLKIYDIITGYGAEVAFPTSTVHIPETVPLPSLTNAVSAD
ncbi:MAG: mechanosensitive ion channel family protein [Candidatus Thiodiazotropha sp. (ex Semelilucina semeliformis)]|nr:mechanosensitive ion channel family protein [Candidatus Thiodiazotropha sp. (ex Semelilucina semeliformis)]